MKLVASREALHRGLQRIGGVVTSAVHQPLCHNVMIRAQQDETLISAMDMEMFLTLKVPNVEVAEEGVALLPYSRLAPVVAATPDEKVELTEDDGAAVIQTGDSRFRILGEDPEDFSEAPALPEEGVVDIDAEILRYMVRRTAFAAAQEKGRYALNGVLCAIGKEGTIEFVAADGTRLAHVKKKVANPDGVEASFIVMTKGMEQLARLAESGSDTLRMAATPSQLVAENDVGRFACQLIEGQFPNYQEVIPAESKVKVQVGAKELLSAVRRASYVTTDEARVVDMLFAAGKVTITAESPDVGRAEVSVPAEYDGEDAQISFNPDYIEDMLDIVEREAVKIRFDDRRSPCVLKSGLDYTYVVSPVIREEGQY